MMYNVMKEIAPIHTNLLNKLRPQGMTDVPAPVNYFEATQIDGHHGIPPSGHGIPPSGHGIPPSGHGIPPPSSHSALPQHPHPANLASHHLPLPQAQTTANYHHLPPSDWLPNPSLHGQQYQMPVGQLQLQQQQLQQQQQQHQPPLLQHQPHQQHQFQTVANGKANVNPTANSVKAQEETAKARQNQRLCQDFSNMQVSNSPENCLVCMS